MGRRAYPGDPGAADNSTRAWQDVLVKRNLLRSATGIEDADTKEGLKQLREDLGLGARSRWTTVWAHAHGVKAADVVDEGPPEGDDDSGAGDGA